MEAHGSRALARTMAHSVGAGTCTATRRREVDMRLIHSLTIVVWFLACCFAACAEEENPASRRNHGLGDADGGLVIPGGDLPDEQFPMNLREPYTGPPIDDYDNTAIGYLQLKARVKRVFADTGIGGNTDIYLA